MTLEEKLIHLRKEKGITQLELAEAVEVSRQAVSKWESGSATPSTEKLLGLSELYGVSVDYLLHDCDLKAGEIEPLPQKAGDDLKTSHGGTGKASVKWFAIIVGFLILIVLIWVFHANKGKEESIHINNMSGGEVVNEPDGSFSIEW